MKTIKELSAELVDYIMTHEWKDFQDQLENDQLDEITPYETRLLIDWMNDNVGTDWDVKHTLSKINHIYAMAACLRFKIYEKEEN
jgi:hypothetical protein